MTNVMISEQDEHDNASQILLNAEWHELIIKPEVTDEDMMRMLEFGVQHWKVMHIQHIIISNGLMCSLKIQQLKFSVWMGHPRVS